MKILEKVLNKSKTLSNTSLDYKIKLLQNVGLNVYAIDKNDEYKNGYILGKMNDKHMISKIY